MEIAGKQIGESDEQISDCRDGQSLWIVT